MTEPIEQLDAELDRILEEDMHEDDSFVDALSQLTDEDIALVNQYSDYLETFKRKAIEKFIRGRIEHSDQDPRELNLQSEIENELMDVTAYNYLLTLK